jgi:hypothetical protein
MDWVGGCCAYLFFDILTFSLLLLGDLYVHSAGLGGSLVALRLGAALRGRRIEKVDTRRILRRLPFGSENALGNTS